MKKNIAMKCTKEQFNTVKEKVIVPADINKLNKNYEYLVSRRRNDFLGVNFYTEASLKRVGDYEIHEQWNEKVFLEACGIEAIPTLEEVREYFKDAEKIESIYGKRFNNKEEYWVDCYFKNHHSFKSFYIDKGTFELWNSNKGYAKIISYKKPKYEITEDQIKEIKELALLCKTSSIVENIKQWFPDASKKELEVGKWYRRGRELLVWNSGKNTFGFSLSGHWNDDMLWSFDIGGNTEATHEEVTEALTKEAVRRGFVKGAYCNHGEPTGDQYKPIKDYFYHERDNCLYGNIENEGGANIFKKGQWATIIPTKTKEEAEKLLKELGHDFKII